MLLELDHISKIYGDLRAVDDLNLTVPEGEWLAIVGSSGSGKTTLMNMIGCMDTPSKGSVKLEGRKLEDLNATQLADVRKNLIGLVFQKFYLVPHLTAVQPRSAPAMVFLLFVNAGGSRMIMSYPARCSMSCGSRSNTSAQTKSILSVSPFFSAFARANSTAA